MHLTSRIVGRGASAVLCSWPTWVFVQRSTTRDVLNTEPMATEEGVRKKLAEAFSPVFLSVVDESDGCGSKFSVIVVSTQFDGVGLLERQRSVNTVLAEEMKTIHALTMKTWTPAQYEKRKSKLQKPTAAAGEAVAAAAPSS